MELSWYAVMESNDGFILAFSPIQQTTLKSLWSMILLRRRLEANVSPELSYQVSETKENVLVPDVVFC